MSAIYDEIEIEDLTYEEEEDIYTYPCPCGDRFEISKEELLAGEEIATCPGCSLMIRVVFDLEAFRQQQDQVAKLAQSVKKLQVA